MDILVDSEVEGRHCIVCENVLREKREQRRHWACRECRDCWPMDKYTLLELTGKGKRPCVLCGAEVDLGEIWPDIRSGRNHWVCVHCRNRLGTDLYEHDPAGDVGCRGDEEIREKGGDRERKDDRVPDAGAFRVE